MLICGEVKTIGIIPVGRAGQAVKWGVGKVFPKAARWIGKPIEWWYKGAENDVKVLSRWKELIYYEIGQKALESKIYKDLMDLDPVTRGKKLVEMLGKWGKVKGLFLSEWSETGKVINTGPTPLGRLIAPKITRGIGVGLHNFWEYLQEQIGAR